MAGKINADNVEAYHARWIAGETLGQLGAELDMTASKISAKFADYGLAQPRDGRAKIPRKVGARTKRFLDALKKRDLAEEL